MGYWTHATAQFFGVKDVHRIQLHEEMTSMNVESTCNEYPEYCCNEMLTSYNVTVSIDEKDYDSCAKIMKWYMDQTAHAFASKLIVKSEFQEHTIETLPGVWCMIDLEDKYKEFLSHRFDTYEGDD